jgi:hypothetical protein
MNNQPRRGLFGLPTLPALIGGGIAAGVGLASEGIHHHKEKKAAKQKLGESHKADDPPSYEDIPRAKKEVADHKEHEETPDHHANEEGDEEQWELDEAQDKLIADGSVKVEPRPKVSIHPRETTQHFVDRHPAPQSLPEHHLPLPVILPQRRPKDRSRGFIRAYAPDLAVCGIDQPMFLDFIETFNEASQASPMMNAINLAGFAFMALPTGISQAATLALALTVTVAKNMQSRSR